MFRNDLNQSLDVTKNNGVQNDIENLVLRQPGKVRNDKNMNKRKPAKAKPVPLQL